MTVGKPKKFKPSEYAYAEKAKGYLKFTVTVVNKSDKPLDLSTDLYHRSVQQQGGRASLRLRERSGFNSRYQGAEGAGVGV